jgi:hypothetical protein
MEYYNYSVDLPYTKTKIYYREINTQEQLLLAKANISIPNNKESLYDYSQFAFEVILNCVKNKEDFYKINIVEYVLFLVKLRIISIGATMDFLLKTGEDTKTKTKIQIDLRKYLVNLYNASNYFETDSVIIENNLEIKLNWPDIKSILTFNDICLSNQTQYEMLNDSLCEYIEYVKIDGKHKLIFNAMNQKEKVKLFEKIPLKLKDKLQQKIIEASKILSEYNLFQVSFFDDYRFNFYNLSFIEHIKMFFSYDLKSLYQEIYFLSNYKLSPSYILSISQSERKIYMSIIEDQNKKDQKSSSNSGDGESYSDAVKKLALEFGDEMPK